MSVGSNGALVESLILLVFSLVPEKIAFINKLFFFIENTLNTLSGPWRQVRLEVFR